ncbi:MAG: Cof-type HAD-IIB family hydrolase [Clostridiales bacterium]|jgi:Cof subfamily protein (haloacid dehalogenase superfamily)|nr:Cof-type HAD-IIB family hydrolase [Clostridiales bacterium]
MQIKLIITDLDNTLLRRDKSISEYTADVLLRCQRVGILIAFATARYFRTVEEWILPNISFYPDIVISDNGGYAYRGKDVLYSATFTPETGNNLIDMIRKHGGAVTAATDTVRYCERPIEKSHLPFSVPYDFSGKLTENFHYIDARGIDIDTVRTISDKFPEIRYEVYNDSPLVTFLHKDAQKGIALRMIIKKLKLLPSEVIGFGDDANDLAFLKVCGIKIAVLNAIDSVKSAADYICGDCDNDGVARWIEKNVFLKSKHTLFR